MSVLRNFLLAGNHPLRPHKGIDKNVPLSQCNKNKNFLFEINHFFFAQFIKSDTKTMLYILLQACSLTKCQAFYFLR
jgi:hypothetical protein